MEPLSDTVTPSPKRNFGRRLLLACFSFALGAGLGVFARRSEGVLTPRASAGHVEPSANSAPGTREHASARLDQLADQRAQLLAQLKSTPHDPELLAKLGYIYLATRDFKEASAYFKRS